MSRVASCFADGGGTMVALAAVAFVLAFLILERFMSTGAQMRGLASSGNSAPRDDVRLRGLRRMGIIRACLVVAPLLGLFGTVCGMIDTFDAILNGGYVSAMSAGISKALLTTQYGLAIAAPGILAEQALVRRTEKLAMMARAARLRAREAKPCDDAS